jgi:putative endonuclease
MTYVYLLRSESHPDQTYIGFTRDLRARLEAHNSGLSRHTARFRPWRLVTYCGFSEPSRATAFEQYLKSHSGPVSACKT